ncbi:MAG: 6-phosphofructokinase [Clostridiaceae bacterium]|jgi:6-phosphofructokinase 1|nr:6-phosphofructokinase [Clostridiaceae bacterium]
MKRIGLLTSGGDCQGLNTALRGVAKALYEACDELELHGFQDGYRGLMLDDARLMQPADFSGILTVGGTILGTSRQPFKQVRDPLDPDKPDGPDKLAGMLATIAKRKLDALVILGGNGTHKTAHLLSEAGVPVVTLPKTIDNDLCGTDITFGFQSAVNIATAVVDGIHTTATSHGRVFIIELMGNKAGHLTLHAGMAGGADVILIPEIPYRMAAVTAALEKRQQQHKRFSIIVIAEGALSDKEAALSRKEQKASRMNWRYPSVAYQLAHDLEKSMGQEIRVTVPGHFQRGGQPCPYDRVLATMLGTAAADLIVRNRFGCMVGLRDGQTVPVPLAEVAGKRRQVALDSSLIRSGRALGIAFGDEED